MDTLVHTPARGEPAAPVLVPRRSRAARQWIRWVRYATQAAVVGFIAWTAVSHVVRGTGSAEAFCPFGAVETTWTLLTTGRTVPHVHASSLILGGAVIVMALAGRSFFCGWLCPFGAIQGAVHTAASWLAGRVRPLRRLRRRAARSAALGRWRRGADRVLRWGRWAVLAWAIIGAAVTGTMVFREADPYVALINIADFELSLAFIVLLASLVLALFVRRPFCRYACPLGAAQGLLSKASPVAVQREASSCAGCDLCNQACPVGIPVNARTRITDTACIGCLECVAACPSRDAIGVTFALPLPAHRSVVLNGESR